jgi:hypothetical protein
MNEELQEKLDKLLADFVDEMYNRITEHERLVIELAMKRASVMTLEFIRRKM